MAKEEKMPKEEKQKPQCNCDSSCQCGCQEGKECHCGEGCGCCCRKKGAFKLLAILIVFLAGMGFNELIHGCCGRCPSKGPRPMPTMAMPHHVAAPMPAANVPNGNNGGTVIIINADGSVQPHHFGAMGKPHGCHCDKNKKHHFGKHHAAAPAEAVNVPQTEAEPAE